MHWHSNTQLASKAPFIIIFMHILVTQGIQLDYPSLHSPKPFSILYWTLVFLVILTYCRTAYCNPGFIVLTTALPSAKDNIEITLSKPRAIFRHLSTENGENEEKNKESEEKVKESEEKNNENKDKIEENGIIELVPVEKIEEPYFVETRFCTVCYLEQPLRAKHCRECGKCVALHDHHCPWLGICIGEKNRFYFWWYLLLECFLLWTSAGLVISSFNNVSGWGWLTKNSLRIGILVILGFFILMVTCLLGYHSFLAIVNQTTWENVSWYKISYLKQRSKKLGSPFSKGICFNLWFYCCKRLPVTYSTWYIQVN